MTGGRFRWRMKDEQEHRRNEIRELQGQGYTITQIAQKKQLSVSTIKRISARLHRESRENYQRLIQERIPYDVDSTLELYRSIKRQAIELSKQAVNDRVKVAALALAKDAGKEYIELEMRGEYVKRSLDVAGEIQKRLDNLSSTQQSKQQQDDEEEDEEDNEEEDDEIIDDPEAVF